MIKKSLLKKLGIILLVLGLLIQFIPSDKTNPVSDPAADFIHMTKAPAGVANLLKNACYDCHSNQSVYPWYSYVAPISWWISNHISEGREELNFSEWNLLTAKEKAKKMKEIREEIQEDEMPLSSYKWLHKKAQLNASEKEILIGFFNQFRQSGVSEHSEKGEDD